MLAGFVPSVLLSFPPSEFEVVESAREWPSVELLFDESLS